MRPDAATRVYEGRTLAVTVERWGDAQREIVERADAVAIVPIDREGRVVLVRQRREAARKELLEIPAGTIEAGEDPEAAARRELLEETGLGGGRWRAGPVVWATPGFCRERIHLFAAEALDEGEPRPEAGEEFVLVRLPTDEALDRCGELEDVKTLAGLLWYAASAGGNVDQYTRRAPGDIVPAPCGSASQRRSSPTNTGSP